MGCCFSKKSSLSPPSITLSNGVKALDPIKQVIEPIEEAKPKSELKENPTMEETKPISEKLHQEDVTTKEVLVAKHRRSHERTKKTDSEDSSASVTVEKSNDLAAVRVSSCTKEEVDAILIQCGKLSRSNSAAKTRRYSGSKRSFDFDQNERIRGGDVEEEDGGEERTHRYRHRGVDRVNGSPRERRRRTPSREREDSGKSYLSGSRERGNSGGGGGGGGSRRVSRSPGKRSELNPISCGGSGISVNSSNIRRGKFVTVPATDKSNNGEPSVKRITVKRSIGEACRTAASPARAASNNAQPPPSLSRSSSRKAEQSPYRRTPLGEIDQNSTKGDKIGTCNTNCNKKMTNSEIESAKPNPKTTIRAASPIRRSRSLRKSRDFDFNPETLQSNEDDDDNNNNNNTNTYTALLLKDIQNFHGKSLNNVDDDVSVPFNLLPSCVTKACSIVEAVADLNSTTNTDSNQFRFTSTTKKADLMEPSFEKYVTLNRGGSLEEQESSGSNNLI